jgi:predicted nucleic acid-binding protein
MLVDSSVWIDAIRNKATRQTHLLKESIKSPHVEILTCAMIIQEVLQGVKKDSQFDALKSQFLNLIILTADQTQVAIEAAQLYRSLRKRGVTIRKPMDCLIAWFAINNNVELLHSDSDFDLIARYTELKIVSLQ